MGTSLKFNVRGLHGKRNVQEKASCPKGLDREPTIKNRRERSMEEDAARVRIVGATRCGQAL